MFDTIVNQSSNAGQADFDETMFGKALAEIVPNKKALDQVLDGLPDKSIPMVDELEKTIMFSMVNLKWNQATRSFISEGELQLNSLGKNKIERKFYGRIEMTKKRSGDDFTFYIQTPEGSWYYFKYQRGMLFTLGSDPLYNQDIKDNFEKISKKEGDFSLRPANIGDRNKLVRNMKTQK